MCLKNYITVLVRNKHMHIQKITCVIKQYLVIPIKKFNRLQKTETNKQIKLYSNTIFYNKYLYTVKKKRVTININTIKVK